MFRLPPRLIFCAALAGLTWWLWPQGELRHAPGVCIDREPVQQMIEPRVIEGFKKYRITAVASYAIEARVLHTKRYWIDGDDLIPYDVAVGWGPMSEQAVLDHFSVSQCNRFFFYEWQNPPPIEIREIERHAANMHVIAANKEVAHAVKRLRRGEFVSMRGFLVNVTCPDGFCMRTSLRREDTGPGACEVFYVEWMDTKPEPTLLAAVPSA